jgi:hypothetical protein
MGLTGNARCRVAAHFNRRLWRMSGQTTAEYAVLTLWTVVGVTVAFEAMRYAILDYYQDVASLICLPIP